PGGGGVGPPREDPPPRVGAIADTVELAFADDMPTLASALEGTDVLLAWQPRSALLAGAWGSATELRWIQSASAGVDRLLFPGLGGSHRGAGGDPGGAGRRRQAAFPRVGGEPRRAHERPRRLRGRDRRVRPGA